MITASTNNGQSAPSYAQTPPACLHPLAIQLTLIHFLAIMSGKLHETFSARKLVYANSLLVYANSLLAVQVNKEGIGG